MMPLAKPDQKVIVKSAGILKPGNTTYLERLHKSFPDIQLLLVVRNPVSRLVSDIAHESQMNRWSTPDLDKMLMNVDGYVEKQGLKGT